MFMVINSKDHSTYIRKDG